MRILSIVGARPQFVKLAPIAEELKGRADHTIVHTGQHYDEMMSDVFFRELGIPSPDVNLAIGSGPHGAQTGAMLAAIEGVLQKSMPDWVLVYGDTNSTLAATLAAVKLQLRVAHLEAGLRSFNRRMPEEHNRVLTDHACDLALAPTQVAMAHLAAEGLSDRSVCVGDVMTDVLYRVRDGLAATSSQLPDSMQPGGYYVATIHRPENTDSPRRLRSIIDGLAALDHPVLLLVHPRLSVLSARHGIQLDRGAIRPIPPLGYPGLVNALQNSRGVITDSGGLQKEAFLLRIPCTTIRAETEWVETVELGWNVLVDSDLSQLPALVERDRPAATDTAPYGTGDAARRVVDELLSRRS